MTFGKWFRLTIQFCNNMLYFVYFYILDDRLQTKIYSMTVAINWLLRYGPIIYKSILDPLTVVSKTPVPVTMIHKRRQNIKIYFMTLSVARFYSFQWWLKNWKRLSRKLLCPNERIPIFAWREGGRSRGTSENTAVVKAGFRADHFPNVSLEIFSSVNLLCNADEATLYSIDDPRREFLPRPRDIVVGALSLPITYPGWRGRIRTILYSLLLYALMI
jgi:hypothetical protein